MQYVEFFVQHEPIGSARRTSVEIGRAEKIGLKLIALQIIYVNRWHHLSRADVLGKQQNFTLIYTRDGLKLIFDVSRGSVSFGVYPQGA
jgi:hypothetical protein